MWKNIAQQIWIEHVFEAYKTIKEHETTFWGYEPSEIVILLPKNQMGAEAVRFSQEHGIDTNHVFVTNKDRKWRNKRISQVNDHRLKISTIHQFKGWESANVILLLPEHWNGADKNMDSVVYTAMTRTL
ncbi:MAG: hypothetical protein A4E25_01751 [Methanobacterium sp. PtaB.Bin024]|jgi:superfamily I DNA and RNA helicase|nr:MAG: hypothetical protein A4E25_01751 [Methanobacterium sp. PtaB.Bin024]